MDTLVRIQVCSIKGISSIQSYDLAGGFGTVKQQKKGLEKKHMLKIATLRILALQKVAIFEEKHIFPLYRFNALHWRVQ